MIEAVKRRVEARTERKGTGPEELLFVTRDGNQIIPSSLIILVECGPRCAAGRIGPRLEGRTSHRGVLQAGQGRSRVGGLSECETGSPGIITKPCRSWPRGS